MFNCYCGVDQSPVTNRKRSLFEQSNNLDNGIILTSLLWLLIAYHFEFNWGVLTLSEGYTCRAFYAAVCAMRQAEDYQCSSYAFV